MTEQQIKGLQGLTILEVKQLREKFGKNELVTKKKESFFYKLLHVISEPMFLVLFVDRVIESILSGVTLAMAMIPEEFPVILTVFLSMGAWRLAKKHSLVRKLPSVETLGAVSVIKLIKDKVMWTVNLGTIGGLMLILYTPLSGFL